MLQVLLVVRYLPWLLILVGVGVLALLATGFDPLAMVDSFIQGIETWIQNLLSPL